MDVLPMIPPDQKFDMTFWSAVLQKTGEEDSWEYEGKYIPDRLTVCFDRLPACWLPSRYFLLVPIC